jgi:hypothetical protein
MKRVLVLIPLLLGACAATGGNYHEAVSPDKATVVVYRTSGVYQREFGIEVSGKVCSLKQDGFYVSKHKGSVAISGTMWDAPGTSRYTFDAKPGRVYYVNVERKLANAAGGFLGGLISEGTSKQSGPFDIGLVDAARAKRELADLHEDCVR